MKGLDSLMGAMNENPQPELVGPDRHLDPEYAAKRAAELAKELGNKRNTPPPLPKPVVTKDMARDAAGNERRQRGVLGSDFE